MYLSPRVIGSQSWAIQNLYKPRPANLLALNSNSKKWWKGEPFHPILDDGTLERTYVVQLIIPVMKGIGYGKFGVHLYGIVAEL